MSALKVAQAGSFRAVMRRDGIGFRRLQKRVMALESKLGMPIFHRTPEGVVPTPEGRLVIEHAKHIEEAVAGILRLGKSLGGTPDGEVVVAVTEGLGTFWIAPRLADFAGPESGLSVRLHPSMTVADMRRFDIDLAIQVIEPVLPEIRRTRLATLHMMLTAAPSYIARHGMPTTAQDLSRHRFVFHSNPQFSDRTIIEKAIGRRLAPSQCLVMRNSSSHYMTVEHGEGIGFIPTYGFAIGAKTVPIELPITHAFDVWLCSHKEARSIPRVSRVMDWLAAIFDPRLYPWFRRDLVPPSRFDQILEQNGAGELMRRFAFNR